MINIYYQNARGLRTKTSSLYRNVCTNSFDVIIFTETWLVDGISDSELFDSRYLVWRRDRDYCRTLQTRGGGVLIAVRNDLTVVERHDWRTSAEDLWISIVLKKSRPAAFDVQGVLAPVFTPFLESGSIDCTIIPSYMAYLNENQINGILVGGTTGEGMSLSVEERKSLLEAWIAAARPFGAKIIAQVGGAPLPDVLELATHADKMKADGIMTLPELYYKPKTVDQLVCYLQRVSEAAPNLPIVYYHFPMMTGVDVSMPKLFQEASTKLPNFKGVKADLGVAMEVAHLLREDQKIFIANHHIAPSVLMGHETSIATITNLFPDLVLSIVSAVKNDDVVKARALQKRVSELVNALTTEGDFVPAMKTAMELVTGIRMGQTRPPLVSFIYEQRTRLKDTLIRLDVKLQSTD